MREQRRHPRVYAQIASEISTGDHFVVAETHTLSLGGAAVLTDESFPVGKTVWLTLLLPEQSGADASDDEDEEPSVEPFESSATVRWSKDRADGMCIVGLKFGPMTAAQKLRLERVVDSLAELPKAGTGA